jgi:hypothetical protein
LAIAICGLMTISLAALAVDLSQTVCEDDLGGTWDAGTNTCTATFIFDPFIELTIPSGMTLDVGDLDALVFDVVNFGTINADFWHNHGTLENYGTLVVGDLIHDNVVNHCGSTYTVTTDVAGSVQNLMCTVALSLTPDPTNGTDPLDVEWTITLTNDGDEALSGVSVELSYDGGATAFQTLTAPPASGDDGDGMLEPAEAWLFTVQTTESADVTVTATSSGTAPSGLDVTFPDDAEARAEAMVAVTAASTTTTTSGATTTTSGTTSSTVASTTTTDAEVAGGAGTLPFTGAGSNTPIAMLALSLLATGVLLVLTARGRSSDH